MSGQWTILNRYSKIRMVTVVVERDERDKDTARRGVVHVGSVR